MSFSDFQEKCWVSLCKNEELNFEYVRNRCRDLLKKSVFKNLHFSFNCKSDYGGRTLIFL